MGNLERDILDSVAKLHFYCIAKATKEKLAEVQWIQDVTRSFSIYFKQLQQAKAMKTIKQSTSFGKLISDLQKQS